MSIKDFKILNKLGQGAYSVVYKVQRLADGHQYALKKVKLGNLSDKEAQNALNQVRILASIHHINIVSYKEAFLQGKSLCIVMEFADDGDLYHKITENKKKKKYFQQDFIWRTIVHVLRGLKQLHSLKILHRDLKTANVFMNKNGIAQLGDMNVSKIAENGLLYTQTGTPYYASPEVWSEQPYDSKSDIWSLGCVLYELTTLQVPFKAEDMEGLSNCVLEGKYSPIPNFYSKQLGQIIGHMLQLKPKLRPSCQKMLKYPIVLKKIEELGLTQKVSQNHNQLMRTIRMPKKLQYLTDRLPKANYSVTQSYKQQNSSIDRERTNTLPKLQKIVKGHEQLIRSKKKSILSSDSAGILYIKGVSKSINNGKSELPNRRQKLQQQINKIYQGKHAVNRIHHSRQNLLPYLRK